MAKIYEVRFKLQKADIWAPHTKGQKIRFDEEGLRKYEKWVKDTVTVQGYIQDFYEEHYLIMGG